MDRLVQNGTGSEKQNTRSGIENWYEQLVQLLKSVPVSHNHLFIGGYMKYSILEKYVF